MAAAPLRPRLQEAASWTAKTVARQLLKPVSEEAKAHPQIQLNHGETNCGPCRSSIRLWRLTLRVPVCSGTAAILSSSSRSWLRPLSCTFSW